MLRPRWRKILADLWGNKARSVLVIASIAVGLFAVGIITTIWGVLSVDMRSGYQAINPANIQVMTDSFNQDLVDQVRHVDGVRDAEGVRIASLRLKTGTDEYTAISLQAIPNFDKMNINQVKLVQGTWPPKDDEIVIERNKLADTHAQLGDQLQIELPSGKIRKLRLVGVVHDQTVGSSNTGGGFFLAPIQGYITQNSLESLELPSTFNQLYVTVAGNSNDDQNILQVANRVRKEVENGGSLIVNTVTKRSDEHPNSTYVDAIAGILLLLGLFVVFLSGFLITNTLSALLNQQIQQIGIIKAIGGRRTQIMGIYMMLIFIYGILAILLAIPLSNMAANRLLEFLSTRINFSLQGYRYVPLAVILQIVIGLVVPQAAAFFPILHGSRIPTQEAISGFSQSGKSTSKTRFDLWLEQIRGLSRPMLISLRNVFRRKGRLALTLITLSLGGAIFIATFNVRASLNDYIAKISKYFLADINLTLDQPMRIEKIQQELSNVNGITIVEGWAQSRCELVLDDGSIGDSIQLLAPPNNSRLIEPILISGRWIQPGDQNAIVLSERFQSRFPNLKPGGKLRLRVNGDETDWVVVGFFQLAGKSGGFLAYTSYETLSRLIHEPYRASTYRIVAGGKKWTLEEQNQFSRQIEAHLRAHGYRIADITAGNFLSGSASKGLNILTIFLLIMAILTALVGSIGLMGTMSLNVMERTREIGIMRAIGASDRVLMKLVMVEGILIGLLSWLAGSLLAFPMSRIMSDTISFAIFDAPSNNTFTPTGFIIWLAVVLVLSVLASVIPARSATRLTIREVLAYE